MAKEIQIQLGTDVFNLAPVKVERKKLYGWTEVKAVDSNGDLCKQVSLASNGTTIIPSGAIKLGVVAENGKWVDKSDLVAVHPDGTKAELCPSTFETGIILERKATNEEVLDLLVSSVYVLDGENESLLAQKIGNDIYSLRFNYRSDYSDSPAFLLSNGQSVFLITGTKAEFTFLSFQEQGDLDLNEEETDDLESDDLDFSMM